MLSTRLPLVAMRRLVVLRIMGGYLASYFLGFVCADLYIHTVYFVLIIFFCECK